MIEKFKYYIISIFILLFTFFIFTTLILSGQVYSYNSTAFGNWAMWVGALSTTLGAIGTVGTLIFIIKQGLKDNLEKESRHAADLYISIVEDLIKKIPQNRTIHSKIDHPVESTLNDLLEIQDKITFYNHRIGARNTHNILTNTLAKYCSTLVMSDFFNVDSKTGDGDSIDYEPTGCAEHLITRWHDFIVKKQSNHRPAFSSTYGFSDMKIHIDEWYSIYSLLTSKPFELIKKDVLKKEMYEIMKTNQANEKSYSLDYLTSQCPMLFSHFALYGNLIAQRHNKDIKISLHVFSQSGYWFVFGINCGNEMFSLPEINNINILYKK